MTWPFPSKLQQSSKMPRASPPLRLGIGRSFDSPPQHRGTSQSSLTYISTSWFSSCRGYKHTQPWLLDGDPHRERFSSPLWERYRSVCCWSITRMLDGLFSHAAAPPHMRTPTKLTGLTASHLERTVLFEWALCYRYFLNCSEMSPKGYKLSVYLFYFLLYCYLFIVAHVFLSWLLSIYCYPFWCTSRSW